VDGIGRGLIYGTILPGVYRRFQKRLYIIRIYETCPESIRPF